MVAEELLSRDGDRPVGAAESFQAVEIGLENASSDL